ncbi:MerR family transcriptional regulator [Cohnella silvisoli]|uniref:MerR family transcriptional regulator n=1 Tax=Cohnella silvisoli TaxID=2873699 RepID=A0ABV1KZC3_9BACL|nr:MerR family transcriptional regulator [Cohnella silvisoli]MCD9024778.1 MerR family transcriptional regulator [Cohnella silvisoli]
MLKISSFSKLSHVSVKTLRYYDHLGLLMPTIVDQSNGYRYYSAEQLLTVKRIQAFKEQGFTLEQIKTFLQEHAASANVKKTLTAKQTELQLTIQEAQRQLNEVSERLTRFEYSDEPDAALPVTMRKVAPELVASIRSVAPRSNLCLLLDEITQYTRSYGEDESRSLIIIWHDWESEDLADMEVAIPIKKSIPENDRVRMTMLPELKLAASVVHYRDPYNNDFSVSDEIVTWITSNGYRVSDKEPIREIYLTADKDIYGNKRKSEILIPIDTAQKRSIPFPFLFLILT